MFDYVLRKRNTLVDYFTNITFDFVGEGNFQSLNYMPVAGRRIIKLDMSQTPNLRVRIAERRALD